MVREVVSPDACVGCLDTEECWVCLGQGTTETRSRAQGRIRVACPVCCGSGDCPHCTAGEALSRSA